MSNLTQFAPFASGGLKSFQTGYFSTGSTTGGSGEDARFLDVTISSVTVAKSIAGVVGAGAAYSLPASFYNEVNISAILTARVTATTTVRIANQANYQYITGRWQVAEAN